MYRYVFYRCPWVTYSYSRCCSLSATASGASKKRRLDVAITGLPNAGKSQLLNVLTQSTVSAVSRKRHTTRHGVLGARTVKDTQLLFLDTPGFLRVAQAKREGVLRMHGDDRRQQSSPSSMMLPSAVDHTLLVVDAARNLTDSVKETLVELMLQAIRSEGRDEVHTSDDDDEEFGDDKEESSDGEEESGDNDDEPNSTESNPIILPRYSIVLNKVDLVHPKSVLLDLAEEIDALAEACLEKLYEGNDLQEQMMPMFFYVSALKNKGVDDLLQYMLDMATPCAVWELEPGASTDLAPEDRAEEIVREKIYRCLHKEVPYQIQQRNTLFRVTKDPNTNILGIILHQELIVRTKSHVELVRGSGGRTLERIRETAERDLERAFGCRVVLQLHIKLNKSKQQPR